MAKFTGWRGCWRTPLIEQRPALPKLNRLKGRKPLINGRARHLPGRHAVRQTLSCAGARSSAQSSIALRQGRFAVFDIHINQVPNVEIGAGGQTGDTRVPMAAATIPDHDIRAVVGGSDKVGAAVTKCASGNGVCRANCDNSSAAPSVGASKLAFIDHATTCATAEGDDGSDQNTCAKCLHDFTYESELAVAHVRNGSISQSRCPRSRAWRWPESR